MAKQTNFYPVILAGGRGTRFWPMSRKRRAKQLLPLDGKQSMIQQTVQRLLPLASANHLWIITNDDLRSPIARQLPRLNKRQILAEPAGRNTAPAIGLAAFLLQRTDPEAVIGMFPSDHVIADEKRYRETIAQGLGSQGLVRTSSSSGSGQPGRRPATDTSRRRPRTPRATVCAFADLPKSQMLSAPTNSCLPATIIGIAECFFGVRARWPMPCRSICPRRPPYCEQIAAAFGTRKFEATFRKLYPKCENISIDYAVLEPRSSKGESASNIFCLPADFGWNDLGSWTALHEHHTAKQKNADSNILVADSVFTLDASGNYIHAPGKFVAAVGVKDLVVVETDDALLITTRQRAQDVGKVVKYLDEKKLSKLT